MRSNYNTEELEAAKTLDMVRMGISVPEAAINRALFVLGDLVGIKL